MMNRRRNPEVDAFCQAVLALQTVDECYDFFKDLCSINELKSITRRFQVACELDEGKSYSEVLEKTGVSTATICRVKKCLDYGNGGYRTVLDRMKP